MAKTLTVKKLQLENIHFNECLKETLSREMLLILYGTGEVIQEYSYDKPYPTYLVLKFVKSKPVHVVVVRNNANKFCFVVLLSMNQTRSYGLLILKLK